MVVGCAVREAWEGGERERWLLLARVRASTAPSSFEKRESMKTPSLASPPCVTLCPSALSFEYNCYP